MVVKQKRSKAKIFIVLIIVLLIGLGIAAFFLDAHRQYKKRATTDAQYYDEALSICGAPPYMVIEEHDGIEGVLLSHYYYPPDSAAYSSARDKAVKARGLNAYQITYVCSEVDADLTGAEQAS